MTTRIKLAWIKLKLMIRVMRWDGFDRLDHGRYRVYVEGSWLYDRCKWTVYLVNGKYGLTLAGTGFTDTKAQAKRAAVNFICSDGRMVK